MNLDRTEEIAEILQNELAVDVSAMLDVKQPFILISVNDLEKVCRFLFTKDGLYFDFLNCITCVDNGVQNGSLDMIYHLTSIPLEHSVILKVNIARDEETLDSVAGIWRSADWHEREIFDLFGVVFNNHPDLRRILLPADWVGYPLRKDYQEQETYHGLKVKSE